MDSYVACSSLLEATMTRNRTKVWDLNYATEIPTQTTKSIALDFGAQGIRAHTVCPGFVDTPLNVPHAPHDHRVSFRLQTRLLSTISHITYDAHARPAPSGKDTDGRANR